MIKFLILISLAVPLALGSGCEDEQEPASDEDLEEIGVSGDETPLVDEGPSVRPRIKENETGDLSLYPPEIDPDGDNVPDVYTNGLLDNCPGTFNPSQDDADGDGAGDACDTD